MRTGNINCFGRFSHLPRASSVLCFDIIIARSFHLAFSPLVSRTGKVVDIANLLSFCYLLTKISSSTFSKYFKLEMSKNRTSTWTRTDSGHPITIRWIYPSTYRHGVLNFDNLMWRLLLLMCTLCWLGKKDRPARNEVAHNRNVSTFVPWACIGAGASSIMNKARVLSK